jgi:hypothetical protein
MAKNLMIKIFITYLKRKFATGEVYYGRTSGYVTDSEQESIEYILTKRDKNHQKNKDGFGNALVDKVSENYDAIRGREDMLIEKAKLENISGNKYRGISNRNKKREQYRKAAILAFGTLCISLVLYLVNYL